MVSGRRGALLAVVLVLSASAAAPQDKVTLVPRRLLLDVAPASGSGFTASDALLVARSLDQRIQEADPSLVVIESAGEAPPASDEAMGSQSNAAGADCWVRVSLDGTWSSARLSVRVVDLLAHSTVADASVSRAGWQSAAGLAQESWADVVPHIAGRFPMRESSTSASSAVPTARLTVLAVPGTVVTGLGPAPLRVEADGTGSLEIPRGREYSLRAVKPGYVPLSQRVFLSEDRRIALKQERSPSMALELSLTDGRAPGADFTVQLPSPSLFARLGVTNYEAGLSLSQGQMFSSYPLTIVALQAGAYVFPEDWSFRLYLGLGAFVRLIDLPGLPQDALSRGGVRFVAGVEFPRLPHGRFYIEYTPTLYHTQQPDAFHASLGTSDTPGWSFGSDYAVTIFSARVGFRWPL